MVLARPIRPLRIALRYWWPHRLTLWSNPCVMAWLWWNYFSDSAPKQCGIDTVDNQSMREFKVRRES